MAWHADDEQSKVYVDFKISFSLVLNICDPDNRPKIRIDPP